MVPGPELKGRGDKSPSASRPFGVIEARDRFREGEIDVLLLVERQEPVPHVAHGRSGLSGRVLESSTKLDVSPWAFRIACKTIFWAPKAWP